MELGAAFRLGAILHCVQALPHFPRTRMMAEGKLILRIAQHLKTPYRYLSKRCHLPELWGDMSQYSPLWFDNTLQSDHVARIVECNWKIIPLRIEFEFPAEHDFL